MKSLFLPSFLVLLGQATASQPSGCQVCASTGRCDAAFHNGPGQYCGSFYDVSTSGNKPCCCPPQATCKVSPTQCMCHVAGPGSPPPPPPPPPPHPRPHDHHHSQYQGDGYHEASPVVPLIVVLLVGVCCCAFCCRRRDGHKHHRRPDSSSDYVPVAEAVHAVPPPENPQYHSHDYGSTKDYGGGGGSGGGGAGTAIASGLGGLAVGTIIGDMMGRNSARANNPQTGFWGGGGGGGGFWGGGSGGGGSGDGGYDIAGDSGGGYDVAGDSGDGGCDIQGDS
ncbi:hypothetical protein ACHAWF_001606 [Thalassiosira exigua]